MYLTTTSDSNEWIVISSPEEDERFIEEEGGSQYIHQHSLEAHSRRGRDRNRFNIEQNDDAIRYPSFISNEYRYDLLTQVSGIAALWRFPNMTYSDKGGAFILAYTIILIIIGLPLSLLEISIGQEVGLSYVKVWRTVNPKLIGLGYSCMFINITACVYYGVIVAWGVFYLLQTIWSIMTLSPLPWSQTLKDTSYDNARRFWFNGVLHLGSNGSDWLYKEWNKGLIMSLVIVWIITASASFWKHLLGRVSVVTIGSLAIFYLISFIRLCSLPGAMDGVYQMMTINSSEMFNLSLWTDAVSQVIFSLGIGYGGLINCSAKRRRSVPIVKDAVLTLIYSWATSIFITLTCFMTVGLMASTCEMGFYSVAMTGVGSSFVMHSVMISALPGSHLWAICYWVLFCWCGISTLQALLTVITEPFMEMMKWRPLNGNNLLYQNRILFLICFVSLILGLPYTMPVGIYWANATDFYTGAFTMIITSLVEVLSVVLYFGISNFAHIWGTLSVYRYLSILITFACPIALIILSIISFIVSFSPGYVSERFAHAGGSMVKNIELVKEVDDKLHELKDDKEIVKDNDDINIEREFVIIDKQMAGEGCGDNDCDPGGHCDRYFNFCRCDYGRTGVYCTDIIAQHLRGCPEMCNGRGSCELKTGTCQCYAGFFGPSCHGEIYSNYWPGSSQIFGVTLTFLILIPLILAGLSRVIRRAIERVEHFLQRCLIKVINRE